jgi:hypothetical protein
MRKDHSSFITLQFSKQEMGSFRFLFSLILFSTSAAPGNMCWVNCFLKYFLFKNILKYFFYFYKIYFYYYTLKLSKNIKAGGIHCDLMTFYLLPHVNPIIPLPTCFQPRSYRPLLFFPTSLFMYPFPLDFKHRTCIT